MATIKDYGKGPEIACTTELRAAGMIEERPGDKTGPEKWSRLADVWFYGFDGMIVVFDQQAVSTAHRVEIICSLADQTESLYEGHLGSVRASGNGAKIHLPGAIYTGLAPGDSVTVRPLDGLLIIRLRTEHQKVANGLDVMRDEQI